MAVFIHIYIHTTHKNAGPLHFSLHDFSGFEGMHSFRNTRHNIVTLLHTFVAFVMIFFVRCFSCRLVWKVFVTEINTCCMVSMSAHIVSRRCSHREPEVKNFASNSWQRHRKISTTLNTQSLEFLEVNTDEFSACSFFWLFLTRVLFLGNGLIPGLKELFG
jgi:hypothetical protein